MNKKPRIKSNICLDVHPDGCKKQVRNQIRFIKGKTFTQGPENVLIIGGSTGFGLAARIVSAFGYKAATFSVAYEKPPSGTKHGTAGWYNTGEFDKRAAGDGLLSVSFNGDAFSHELKHQVCGFIASHERKIDLLIYSIATSVRRDPCTGVLHRGVIKPIDKAVAGQTIDLSTVHLKDFSMEPADDLDVFNTQKVMGGEDWLLWVKALKKNNLIADNFRTVAFSYIGPVLTYPIYRDGTLGKAKLHLEKTAGDINTLISDNNGKAFVSVNKAVVTKSSSVIPMVPLYIAILYKVMKGRGVHEGCLLQMHRLFTERLYTGREIQVDEEGRIRIDDLELDEQVQQEVMKIWNRINDNNIVLKTDIMGYIEDFLNIHGFSIGDYSPDDREERSRRKEVSIPLI